MTPTSQRLASLLDFTEFSVYDQELSRKNSSDRPLGMTDVAPRRRKVFLGLVGTGPLWEWGYRDAVRRHLHHVVVRGVYDAVPARSEQTAREWQAVPVPSLTALFERTDIDGVIILDPAWFGVFPLQLACRYVKPTLLARPCEGYLSEVEEVQRAAQEAGVMIMAAFPRRHTPAMNRLRELMVTRLGSPTSIRLDVADTAVQNRRHLAELLDWCTYVAGRPPVRVTASPETAQVDLEFPTTAGALRPVARIVLRPLSQTDEPSLEGEALHVVCQRGSAEIRSDAEIAWRNGKQEVRDNLSSERSSAEIILDQFCRRVVGGLVPVSDLTDALRAWRHAEAVWSQFSPE